MLSSTILFDPTRLLWWKLWIASTALMLAVGLLVVETLPERIPQPESDGPPINVGLAPEAKRISPGRAEQLAAIFDEIGFSLSGPAGEGRHVPRLEVTLLPRDLPAIEDPELRKSLFLRTLLPLILLENERITARRAKAEALLQALDSDQPLGRADKVWLQQTSVALGLEELDPTVLLRRLDVIPPSLALAQAAQESGWGTSRFALEGNALYGQRTWSGSGSGLKPGDADARGGFRVRSFANLRAAIRSYFRNLNVHSAYAELRRTRAALRARGQKSSGLDLAPTMIRYSEEGQNYIARLRAIIRSNDLTKFDGARLEPDPA